MNANNLKLEELRKTYKDSKIISLERVEFKNYQVVSNLDDLISNSTLVGHYYEELEYDTDQSLFEVVDEFLKMTCPDKPEEKDDYDYFEDDFMDFILKSDEKSADNIRKNLGTNKKYARVAIVSLDYKMVYLFTDKPNLPIHDLFNDMATMYKLFVDKIDKEL